MNKLKFKGEWNEVKGKRKQKEGSAMKVWIAGLGVLLLLNGVIGCSTTEKQRSSEVYSPPPASPEHRWTGRP
jgi:hypothetical protein